MNRRAFLGTGVGTALTASRISATELEMKVQGRPKVLMSPPDEESVLEFLRKQAPNLDLVVCSNAAELEKHLETADATYGLINPEILKKAKRLRWVQNPSAGVEGILAIPGFVASEIILTNMQRTFGPEIADQAMAYLLAFTRGLGHAIREKTWTRPTNFVFEELQGKTLLIVGLGGIGDAIARRAWTFGMRVLATDPKVIEKPLYVDRLAKPNAFHELLPQADVLASAAPMTDQTKKMFGQREFTMMKKGSIFINVSRGGLADTKALIQALDSGQIAAAGLDVTDPEPLPADHPLWQRNVIITPHTAGQSPGGKRRAWELFAENLRRFASGEMLVNIVDKHAGY